MVRTSVSLLVLMVTTVIGMAQMTVVSTIPQDGAVSVPAMTTLSVTFTQPLDTAYNRNSRGAVMTMIMSGGIQNFGDYSYSADLRTYLLNLALAPNRDFFFVVADARSTTGDTLQQFAPIRFSTTTTRGHRSISGQVFSQNGDLSRTVVFLTELYPVIEPGMFDGSLGCLYDTSAAGYVIADARSSYTYWICALQFIDGFNHQVNVGFYDPDHNGHADSIVVGANDYTGINITTFPLGAMEPREHGIPDDISLSQNFPNPFNPSTTLTFGVPRASNVSLDIFDVLGRKTQTLLSGMMPAGEHSVTWNCPTCPSGMYVVRMQAGGQTMQRKMLLLK